MTTEAVQYSKEQSTDIVYKKKKRLAKSGKDIFHPNVYSFHRGVSFFPPWWKESFPVMESNFLHGGKNKYLLQISLTVAVKRNKSGDAAA